MGDFRDEGGKKCGRLSTFVGQKGGERPEFRMCNVSQLYVKQPESKTNDGSSRIVMVNVEESSCNW